MTQPRLSKNTPLHSTATRYIIMLQSLSAAPTRVAELLQPLNDDGFTFSAGGDGWNMRQTVSHLAAAESPLFLRIKRILNEDNPFLPYFGPDVAVPDDGQPVAKSLVEYRRARDQLVTLLTNLLPNDWERPAVHETLGATTLAMQVQNIVNHDLEHYGQLLELRRAWEKSQL